MEVSSVSFPLAHAKERKELSRSLGRFEQPGPLASLRPLIGRAGLIDPWTTPERIMGPYIIRYDCVAENFPFADVSVLFGKWKAFGGKRNVKLSFLENIFQMLASSK